MAPEGLSDSTDLDPGRLSRIIKRLAEEELLERDGPLLRPRDPDLLLDAWAEEYCFDRHDIQTGHLISSGLELAHASMTASSRPRSITRSPCPPPMRSTASPASGSSASTSPGIPATPPTRWSCVATRGANGQLIGPDDRGVFDGGGDVDGLPCVTRVQVYLDRLHLPERAARRPRNCARATASGSALSEKTRHRSSYGR